MSICPSIPGKVANFDDFGMTVIVMEMTDIRYMVGKVLTKSLELQWFFCFCFYLLRLFHIDIGIHAINLHSGYMWNYFERYITDN